jgi:uncharacterized phiE125 gp8 family phage protein
MISCVKGADVPLLTLEEVKAHLRLDSTFEDDYLNTLIQTATAALEQETGRSFLTKQWRIDYGVPYGTHRQRIELPYPPLLSVETINHVYEAIRRPIKRYSVDINLSVPVLEFDISGGHVEITYTAGYGAWPTAVPEPLRYATLALVGELYENRGLKGLESHSLALQLVRPYTIRRIW